MDGWSNNDPNWGKGGMNKGGNWQQSQNVTGFAGLKGSGKGKGGEMYTSGHSPFSLRQPLYVT